MTETEIKEIVQKQRSYFYTGATLPVEKRLDALKKLKTCIQKYEPLINEALKRDLGKSNFESYMCEVGLVLSELSYMIRHTPSYAKEKNSTDSPLPSSLPEAIRSHLLMVLSWL